MVKSLRSIKLKSLFAEHRNKLGSYIKFLNDGLVPDELDKFLEKLIGDDITEVTIFNLVKDTGMDFSFRLNCHLNDEPVECRVSFRNYDGTHTTLITRHDDFVFCGVISYLKLCANMGRLL